MGRTAREQRSFARRPVRWRKCQRPQRPTAPASNPGAMRRRKGSTDSTLNGAGFKSQGNATAERLAGSTSRGTSPGARYCQLQIPGQHSGGNVDAPSARRRRLQCRGNAVAEKPTGLNAQRRRLQCRVNAVAERLAGSASRGTSPGARYCRLQIPGQRDGGNVDNPSVRRRRLQCRGNAVAEKPTGLSARRCQLQIPEQCDGRKLVGSQRPAPPKCRSGQRSDGKAAGPNFREWRLSAQRQRGGSSADGLQSRKCQPRRSVSAKCRRGTTRRRKCRQPQRPTATVSNSGPAQRRKCWRAQRLASLASNPGATRRQKFNRASTNGVTEMLPAGNAATKFLPASVPGSAGPGGRCRRNVAQKQRGGQVPAGFMPGSAGPGDRCRRNVAREQRGGKIPASFNARHLPPRRLVPPICRPEATRRPSSCRFHARQC